MGNPMELTMLTCDHCGGKNWEGGLTPTKGRSPGDMREEVRSTGKIFGLCRQCQQNANLRIKPLEAKSPHLLHIPPVPPEAHAFQLNPRRPERRAR